MNLEEAKHAVKDASIVSFIETFIPLRKKGANYEGLCPFHPDSHPSLKVNDSKGMFKCFVCGAGGDAITFTMKFKNIDFVEAVEHLADQVGITIDKTPQQKDPKWELAERVLSSANRIYQRAALTSPQFKDFIKKRKLTAETVEKFQLGFAPNTSYLTEYYNALPQEHRQPAIDMALKLGLIKKNDYGKTYDFFRNRIIFPIHDTRGQVRGFSSRALTDEQQPKYLNSPDSFYFNKGNLLYGQFMAKQTIREQRSIILVEGQMDVIMLHQFGQTNAVAGMGTAITEKSFQQLKTQIDKLYFGLDSDQAGIRAMDRMLEFCLKLDLFPKYLSFSPYKDPDEFLLSEGRLSFLKLLENAPGYLDKKILSIIENQSSESSEGKFESLKLIFKELSPLKDSLIAIDKAIEAATRLKINASSSDVLNSYREFLDSDSRNTRPAQNFRSQVPQTQNQRPTENNQETSNLQKSSDKAAHLTTNRHVNAQKSEKEQESLSRSTKRVLNTVLLYPCLTELPEFKEILDLLPNNEVKRLLGWLSGIYPEIDRSHYASFIIDFINKSDNLPSEIRDTVAVTLFDDPKLTLPKNQLKKMVNDLIVTQKKETLKIKKEHLIQRQSSTLDQEEIQSILREIQQVQKELININNQNILK